MSRDVESETEVGSGEDEDPPDSPTDDNENIKTKFLVDMPEDFYHFWDFAKSVNSGNPSGEDIYYRSIL